MTLKLSLFFGVCFTILFFQNCGQDLSVLSHNSSSAKGPASNSDLDTNKSDEKKIKESEIVSARYWRGGWFGAPNTPNWSHDMDFIFNEDSTITVKSKTIDSLCFKTEIILDRDQRKKWEILYAALAVNPIPNDGPMMADGGAEVLILVFSDKSTTTIHLAPLDAGPGDLLASNGEDMIAHLRGIDKEMPMGCQ